MSILDRYVLRQHVAPFVFSASALTILMLLDQVAKKFGKLVGKGLGWKVISEVFLYSVPFIFAVIFPMAVLVAVLYAFNRLAADNEISAIKASGVSLARLTAPVLVAATLLAAAMVWFNDAVLPESNHRLQLLLTSIGQKKPTFVLREQTVNEVLPSRLYLRAATIDRARNRLVDVTIFDERDAERSRTIYADSGFMAYSDPPTDLYLTLYDGVFSESRAHEPESHQRVFFRKDYMRVAGIGNEFRREDLGGRRSDREMPIAQMRELAAENRDLARQALEESRAISIAATRRYLGRLAGGPEAEAEPDTAAAAAADTAGPAAPDPIRQARELGSRLVSASAAANTFRTRAERVRSRIARSNQFEVEIQKKFSIPAACIVFVLIGAPIAVRYRRGGVGMVVGVSLVVFCAYYVALIGGEHLADKTVLSPFWAMWSPNVLFGGIGIAAFWRARRAGG
ncbi:MAG: LptF/LptG family permease [Gemmatimonadota bacterium]